MASRSRTWWSVWDRPTTRLRLPPRTGSRTDLLPLSGTRTTQPDGGLADNERMDVAGLLESAGLLVPEETGTENDITVRDIWDYLVHDEWETALGLLEELGAGHPLPLTFWEKLADAAEQLRLERSSAWCQWRGSEIRNGMVRADLTLRPVGEARRATPIAGHGVLRPMWDIGHLSPAGERALNVARLWVEDMPSLEPGERATVRLLPLTPSQWKHVRPGQLISMHEDRSVAGTAVIREVHRPAIAAPAR